MDKLPDTKSSTFILKLKNYFARYGCPDQVVSDNGPPFASKEFDAFARAWEFNYFTSIPGYSKSNGEAESAVKTAKQLIRKVYEAGTDPYVAIVDYRNTPAKRLMS